MGLSEKATPPPVNVVPRQGVAAQEQLQGIPTTLDIGGNYATVVGEVRPIAVKLKLPENRSSLQPGQWDFWVRMDEQEFFKLQTGHGLTGDWWFLAYAQPPYSQGTHVLEVQFRGLVGPGFRLLPSKAAAKIFIAKAKTFIQVDVSPMETDAVRPGMISLRAHLMDLGYKSLDGRLVSFKVNGKDVGSATTQSTNLTFKGATLKYMVLSNALPGVTSAGRTVTVEAFFAGDDYYLGTSGKSSTYKVIP